MVKKLGESLSVHSTFVGSYLSTKLEMETNMQNAKSEDLIPLEYMILEVVSDVLTMKLLLLYLLTALPLSSLRPHYLITPFD